jgi:hypothetical protein
MPISRGSLHSLPDGPNHQKEREIRERLKSRGASGGGIVEVRGKENWKLGIDEDVRVCADTNRFRRSRAL